MGANTRLQVDVDPKDTEEPGSVTFNSFLETTRGEEFMKANQRRSISTDRRSNKFTSSSVPVTLNTIMYDVRRKVRRLYIKSY